MRVYNKLVDHQNRPLTKNELVDRKKKRFKVVYAHVDIVNDNGLKLNTDSLQVTREKYPLLIEHADNRVEDVVGYIETDGKPNESGEFVGYITFYDTEQAQHAHQLWVDEVLNELSVSYYITEYEVIDNLDDTEYINVISAILKEVSIVSVGADRDTHEVDDEPTEEPEDELPEEPEDELPDEPEDELPDNSDELDDLKLNYLKSLVNVKFS